MFYGVRLLASLKRWKPTLHPTLICCTTHCSLPLDHHEEATTIYCCSYMRYEVLMMIQMSVLIFGVITLCGLTGNFKHFGETYPSSALKMETVCFSEVLISIHKSTHHYNPEGQHRHTVFLYSITLNTVILYQSYIFLLIIKAIFMSIILLLNLNIIFRLIYPYLNKMTTVYFTYVSTREPRIKHTYITHF
jgi:hypothetical protein